MREGRAHAALVYDGATCVGWCQFGSPDELPRIKHRRAYEPTSTRCRTGASPASSSTGEHRRQGVAAAALAGALDEIARLGGGTVESYPEDTDGRTVSSSFLHNGTVADVRAPRVRAHPPARQAPLGRRAGRGVRGGFPPRRPFEPA